MNPPFAPREARLLLAVLALVAFALFGPALAQPASYHAFADQHLRWGLAHAGDVLSNLPFALVGLAGAWRLARASGLAAVERGLGALACAGLVLTGAGSTWYHLNPDDAGLVVDRLAMAVAFAGLLGLAACRVSARAGAALAAFLLVAAPLSVASWATTGNLTPWAALQAGGLLLLVVLAATTAAPAATPIRWGWVVAGYALAKLLELGDHAVWEFTGQWLSGHSLKHVVAALAVVPVIAAWRPGERAGQNAGQRAHAA